MMIRSGMWILWGLGLTSLLVQSADPPLTLNPVGYPRSVQSGGGSGVVRIWYEDEAWHLATSTDDSQGKKEKLLVFTGQIRSQDKLTIEEKKLEKGKRKTTDSIVVHKDGKGFDFRFATYGAVDQVDFHIGQKGKTVEFKLQLDGQKIHPNRVFIGEDAKHPSKDQFSFPVKPAKPEPKKSD